MDNFSYPFKKPATACSYALISCQHAPKVKWHTILNTVSAPKLSFFQIWNVYSYMVLFTTFVQTKFKPYSLYCFSKYKIFKQKFKCFKYCFLKTEHFVLWDKMAKTNLINWCVFYACIMLQQLTWYRALWKNINYSIWPMRISRPDKRRRYSKLHAIRAGSHFTLSACSQTNALWLLRN